MTDKEKEQLVRESLRFVRDAIKDALDKDETSGLTGALYVIGLLDGSGDGSTFGPSETNET
jgi:hypothetical protein